MSALTYLRNILQFIIIDLVSSEGIASSLHQLGPVPFSYVTPQLADTLGDQLVVFWCRYAE